MSGVFLQLASYVKRLGLIDLQEIILQIDEMCREEEATYRDRTIGCSELSLWLAPCCFHAPDWDVGDNEPSFLTQIDWSHPDKATKGIVDDSGEKLAPELTRLDWRGLRDWYKRLGFVEVDGLDYSEEWNEEHLRVVRHPMKRPRSFEIGRVPMFWPSENAQGYMEEEDKKEQGKQGRRMAHNPFHLLCAGIYSDNANNASEGHILP
jgi:hypothetical protein